MLERMMESLFLRRVARNLISRINYDIQLIPNETISAWLNKEKIATIIDVGAFNGTWMIKWRKMAPSAQIYCFEPLKNCYKILEKKAQSLPNVKTFNMAIGDQNGYIEMYHNRYGPSSSILKITDVHIMNYPYTSTIKTEKVQIMRLDDIMKDEKMELNILIKVDVQGFEDRVIKGGVHTFGKAKMAIIETSFIELYEKQLLFRDIYLQMEKIGFAYAGSLKDEHSKIDGSIIQQDSVFIKG